MKAVAKKTKKTSSTKATGKKKAESVLSICPVNGAGWCPYPFSTAQLKKRLKRIQQAESEDSAVNEKNELNKAARAK